MVVSRRRETTARTAATIIMMTKLDRTGATGVQKLIIVVMVRVV